MVGRSIVLRILCFYILDSKKYSVKEVLAISLLCLPLIYELLDDRKNDFNKAFDVVVRVGLALLSSIYAWFIGHSYLSSLALSFGIFFLLFDYLIHIIMLRRRDFFSYLGTTSRFDKMKIWIKLEAWGRFAVRAGVFLIAVFWYISS